MEKFNLHIRAIDGHGDGWPGSVGNWRCPDPCASDHSAKTENCGVCGATRP